MDGDAGPPALPGDRLSDTTVTIAGGGLIGTSWAALFRHFGAQVVLWDPELDARRRAVQRVEHAAAQLIGISPAIVGGTLDISHDLADAVRDADLVQECAPETISVKHDLFRQIEAAASPKAIIASSTSALTWPDLSPALRLPGRFITAHPFNPPHLIPLVEIYGIDPAVVQRADTLYAAAARVPVILKKPATGHIANRLSSALWREAVHIVAEGIADVAGVDAALVNGPGLRWTTVGAHLTYHLGGGDRGLAGYLEHLGASQERRWADLGAPLLDESTRSLLVDGIADATAGEDIATLATRRDEALIQMIRSRR